MLCTNILCSGLGSSLISPKSFTLLDILKPGHVPLRCQFRLAFSPVWASDQDGSGMPPLRGVLGTSDWAEAPGLAQGAMYPFWPRKNYGTG